MPSAEDLGAVYGTKNYLTPNPEYPATVDKVRIKPYNQNLSGGFM